MSKMHVRIKKMVNSGWPLTELLKATEIWQLDFLLTFRP